MPTVYGGREAIPDLKGRLRNGIAIVVHTPAEITGLQRLLTSVAALPGDTLQNTYRVVAQSGSALASWPGFAPRTGVKPGVRTESPEEHISDSKAAALYAALQIARELWINQGTDANELACAMVLPRPGRRVSFETRRPSLTLDYGSIRARVLAAGGRLRAWGVVLFPVARSRRQIDLVKSLRANAVGTRLPELESLQPSDFEGKSSVVVFLHGLISTDVGTFDTFINLLRKRDPRHRMLLTAWPHDTLDRIKLNADELSEHIERKIGPTPLPVAFVCHSRGGLVARRTVVKLLKTNAQWRSRLRACVTFGTPHEGAELAEKGDEFLGKLLLMHVVRRQANGPPLVDALWTAKEFGKLPGVQNLRPRKNGGTFLEKLCAAEGKLTGEPGTLPVPTYVIGGNNHAGGLTGWLTRRFFRGTPNDLVVALSSTAPPHLQPQAQTTADHFSYFSIEESRKPFVIGAARFVEQALAPERKESAGKSRRSGG